MGRLLDPHPDLAQRRVVGAARHEHHVLAALRQAPAEIRAEGARAHDQDALVGLSVVLHVAAVLQCAFAPHRYPGMPPQSPARQPIIVLFTIALGLTVALLELGLVAYAYERIGLESRYLISLLALCSSAATSTCRSPAPPAMRTAMRRPRCCRSTSAAR